MTRMRALVGAAVVAGSLAGAGAAHAATRDAAGRVYVLATTSDVSQMAVGADWTIYGVTEGAPWRLRATDLARTPIPQPGDQEVRDLAVAPDGALLMSDGRRLWRRGAGGTTTPIAGADPEAGDTALRPAGPGPIPASSPLCAGPVAVSAAAGVVFGDSDAFVRRLRGDSLEAVLTLDPTAATIPCGSSERVIADLAADRAGDVFALIGDSGGRDQALWRIPRVGEPTLVYRGRGVTSIAAAGDGVVTLARHNGVTRFRPGDAHSTRVVRTGWAEDVELEGAPASRVGAYAFTAATAPDGGLVLGADADTGAVVLYVAPERPGRTAVALLPRRGRVDGAAYTLPFRVTRDARAVMTVRDNRGTVRARSAGSVRAGIARLRVRTGASAATYTVRMDARGPRGQRVSRETQRVLGATLSLPAARGVLVPSTYDLEQCAYRARFSTVAPVARSADCSSADVPVTASTCRRVGPRQVECSYGFKGYDGPECRGAAMRLTARGTAVGADGELSCGPGGRPALPPTALALPHEMANEFVPQLTGR